LWLLAVSTIALGGLAFCSKALPAATNGALLTGTVKAATGEKDGRRDGFRQDGRADYHDVCFTDEEGNYYFPALDAGKYQVWAQADTFETARAAVERPRPGIKTFP